MASPTLLSEHGLRIAVEGCGHGVLHEIYASVTKACELKGWSGVDLLIIGGDFQVCMSSSARSPCSDLQGCAQCVRLEGSLYAS
jgi:lariat debranching enzyme